MEVQQWQYYEDINMTAPPLKNWTGWDKSVL